MPFSGAAREPWCGEGLRVLLVSPIPGVSPFGTLGAVPTVVEVAPGDPIDDLSDGRWVNTEPTSSSALRHAIRTERPDLDDLLWGQTVVRVRSTFERRPAPLLPSIGHVVLVGAKEEVGRIDARRVVAVVADVECAGIAVCECPGDPVGVDLRSTYREDAMPSVGATGGPRPTLGEASLVHPCPEPSLYALVEE